MFMVEKLPTGDSVANLYAVSSGGIPRNAGKELEYSHDVANVAVPIQWFYQAIKDYRASSVGADLIWKIKSE
jgi:hypothetical protein